MLFHISPLGAPVRCTKRLRTVYFHNLARFDGILVLNYYATNKTKDDVSTGRNGVIYEYEIKWVHGPLFCALEKESDVWLTSSILSKDPPS